MSTSQHCTFSFDGGGEACEKYPAVIGPELRHSTSKYSPLPLSSFPGAAWEEGRG